VFDLTLRRVSSNDVDALRKAADKEICPMMRSNYFAVKDEQSFLDFCRRHKFEAIKNKENLCGFLHSESMFFQDGEGDDLHWDEEDGIEALPAEALYTCPHSDLVDDLADQLAYDNVAVVMEVDYDKRRWISGSAWAVNSRHETQKVDLDDIYDLARQLGPFVTEASY